MAESKTIDTADKAFAAASTDAARKPPTESTAKPMAKSTKAKAKAKATAAKPAPAKPATATPAAKAAARPVTAKPKTAAKRTTGRKTKPHTVKPQTKSASARRAAVQKGSNIMNDTVKKMTDTATKMSTETKARVETMVADTAQRTREAMERSSETAGELVAFSKGNVEAIVESTKIAAEGVKSMGEDAVAFGRRSVEDATAAVKQIAAAKNPAEAMQLHGDYARSAFDALVAQASKSSETMLKLVGESFQPIANRYAVAASKVKVAA